MKGKKILIISIVIILILALAGGAAAYAYIATDLFKLDEQLFYKYIAEVRRNLEKL